MKLNEIKLTEAKKSIDQTDHTVWISPQGMVYSLKDHGVWGFHGPPNEEEGQKWISSYSLDDKIQPALTHFTWIAYNWDRLDFTGSVDREVFDQPYQRGWIRIRNHHAQFNIQATLDDAKKQFKIWWPAVQQRMLNDGDVFVFVDSITDGQRDSLAFELPQEKRKLLNWAGQTVNENFSSMYGITQPKRQAAIKTDPASNDVYVDLSEEHPNMIAVTLKGRTALIPFDRAERLATKLLRLIKNEME